MASDPFLLRDILKNSASRAASIRSLSVFLFLEVRLSSLRRRRPKSLKFFAARRWVAVSGAFRGLLKDVGQDAVAVASRLHRDDAEAQVCLDLARRQCGGINSRSILVMRRSNDVEWGRPKPEPKPDQARHRAGRLGRCYSIDVAIAEERRFNREVMVAVLVEVNDDLERAVRSLTVELADLKATLAEVRLAFATDRTQVLELPNPLSKRSTEHRDTQAIHAKLDELLRAEGKARDELTMVDQREPEEIEAHRQMAQRHR